MSTIPEELDRITTHVARHGIAASEPQLRRVAFLANTFGVKPSIVSLLTDRTAPDVVRSRAFARVATGLRSLPARPALHLAA